MVTVRIVLIQFENFRDLLFDDEHLAAKGSQRLFMFLPAALCQVERRFYPVQHPLQMSVPFLKPCHLDGLENSFATMLRIIVKFIQCHDPVAQIDEIHMHGVCVGMCRFKLNGNIKGVSPFQSHLYS
jgi:hypothetical protein